MINTQWLHECLSSKLSLILDNLLFHRAISLVVDKNEQFLGECKAVFHFVITAGIIGSIEGR